MRMLRPSTGVSIRIFSHYYLLFWQTNDERLSFGDDAVAIAMNRALDGDVDDDDDVACRSKNHKCSGKIKYKTRREALMIISDIANSQQQHRLQCSRSQWNEKWMINNKNEFYYMNFIRLPGLLHAIESSNQPVHSTEPESAGSSVRRLSSPSFPKRILCCGWCVFVFVWRMRLCVCFALSCVKR